MQVKFLKMCFFFTSVCYCFHSFEIIDSDLMNGVWRGLSVHIDGMGNYNSRSFIRIQIGVFFHSALLAGKAIFATP